MFRHHFFLAIRCKKFNGIFFRTNNGKKHPQTYQTTDFMLTYRPSRTSLSSKINSKTFDFNSLYEPYPQQQETTIHVSTSINESIALRENQQTSTVLPNI